MPKWLEWGFKGGSEPRADANQADLGRIADTDRISPETLAMGHGDFECTICRERHAITPFEQRTDLDGIVHELWMCLRCNVLLNVKDLKQSQGNNVQDQIQSDTSEEFYRVGDDYLLNVAHQVDADGFTEFLFEKCPDLNPGIAMEFGAGRGITAAAAAKKFEKVYAAELTLKTLLQVHEHMPQRDKVVPTENFLDIPEKLDAIYAMHTLEHLPNLRDFLNHFEEMLAPGGVLFFQVPMVRREYLVCVHYTFFNEASCRAMANILSLKLVGIWFDHANDFLTCIMRKDASLT